VGAGWGGGLRAYLVTVSQFLEGFGSGGQVCDCLVRMVLRTGVPLGSWEFGSWVDVLVTEMAVALMSTM
jgi:hypothetical protein